MAAMPRRLTIAVLVAACLALPCSAMAAGLTRKQAIRAVEREVRASYDVDPYEVTCKKLTAKMQRCRFEGLHTREQGLKIYSGTASVRRYRYGIDVRVLSFRRGFPT